MNSENFKTEFRKFLSKYTEPVSDKSSLSVTLLTKQEICGAVLEVLGLKLDATMVVSIQDDVRTPASGIVITTPDAPDIPKINVERNIDTSKRFRSSNALAAESRDTNSSNDHLSLPGDDSLSCKIEENNNTFDIDVQNGRFNDKKGISKSSPAVSTLVRSDTFVRDEEFKSVENGDVFDEKKIDSTATNEFVSEYSLSGIDPIDFVKKIKMLIGSATDVINKIEDIQKDVPVTVRPIRRVSAMGGFPGLNRTSKLTRRSLSAFPGTPTSSRPSLGPSGTKDAAPARSKSTSTIAMMKPHDSKLTMPSTYRSVSSGSLTLPKTIGLTQGSQSSTGKSQKTLGMRSPALSSLNRSDKPDNREIMILKCPRVQNSTDKLGNSLGKRKAN